MPRKYIPIKEFRELGFLQEANRLFFHPHGLALEVVVAPDGGMSLGGVWDYREDPEGIVFEEGGLSQSKAYVVASEKLRHEEARTELLGGSIQEMADKSGGPFTYADGPIREEFPKPEPDEHK